MNFIHQKFPNSFQITFNCELISLRILVHEKFSEHSSRPFARQWIIPSISTLWQQHRNPFITFHEFFAKGSLRMLYFLNKTYNNNNGNNIDITTSYYNTSGTCNEKLFNYLINVSWRFSFPKFAIVRTLNLRGGIHTYLLDILKLFHQDIEMNESCMPLCFFSLAVW